MKKFSLLFVLLLAIGMVLAACGNSDSEGTGNGNGNDNGGEEWLSDITILTGGELGVYFPLGGAMARIITENVDE